MSSGNGGSGGGGNHPAGTRLPQLVPKLSKAMLVVQKPSASILKKPPASISTAQAPALVKPVSAPKPPPPPLQSTTQKPLPPPRPVSDTVTPPPPPPVAVVVAPISEDAEAEQERVQAVHSWKTFSKTAATKSAKISFLKRNLADNELVSPAAGTNSDADDHESMAADYDDDDNYSEQSVKQETLGDAAGKKRAARHNLHNDTSEVNEDHNNKRKKPKSLADIIRPKGSSEPIATAPAPAHQSHAPKKQQYTILANPSKINRAQQSQQLPSVAPSMVADTPSDLAEGLPPMRFMKEDDFIQQQQQKQKQKQSQQNAGSGTHPATPHRRRKRSERRSESAELRPELLAEEDDADDEDDDDGEDASKADYATSRLKADRKSANNVGRDAVLQHSIMAPSRHKQLAHVSDNVPIESTSRKNSQQAPIDMREYIRAFKLKFEKEGKDTEGRDLPAGASTEELQQGSPAAVPPTAAAAAAAAAPVNGPVPTCAATAHQRRQDDIIRRHATVFLEQNVPEEMITHYLLKRTTVHEQQKENLVKNGPAEEARTIMYIDIDFDYAQAECYHEPVLPFKPCERKEACWWKTQEPPHPFGNFICEQFVPPHVRARCRERNEPPREGDCSKFCLVDCILYENAIRDMDRVSGGKRAMQPRIRFLFGEPGGWNLWCARPPTEGHSELLIENLRHYHRNHFIPTLVMTEVAVLATGFMQAMRQQQQGAGPATKLVALRAWRERGICRFVDGTHCKQMSRVNPQSEIDFELAPFTLESVMWRYFQAYRRDFLVADSLSAILATLETKYIAASRHGTQISIALNKLGDDLRAWCAEVRRKTELLDRDPASRAAAMSLEEQEQMQNDIDVHNLKSELVDRLARTERETTMNLEDLRQLAVAEKDPILLVADLVLRDFATSLELFNDEKFRNERMPEDFVSSLYYVSNYWDIIRDIISKAPGYEDIEAPKIVREADDDDDDDDSQPPRTSVIYWLLHIRMNAVYHLLESIMRPALTHVSNPMMHVSSVGGVNATSAGGAKKQAADSTAGSTLLYRAYNSIKKSGVVGLHDAAAPIQQPRNAASRSGWKGEEETFRTLKNVHDKLVAFRDCHTALTDWFVKRLMNKERCDDQYLMETDEGREIWLQVRPVMDRPYAPEDRKQVVYSEKIRDANFNSDAVLAYYKTNLTAAELSMDRFVKHQQQQQSGKALQEGETHQSATDSNTTESLLYVINPLPVAGDASDTLHQALSPPPPLTKEELLSMGLLTHTVKANTLLRPRGPEVFFLDPFKTLLNQVALHGRQYELMAEPSLWTARDLELSATRNNNTPILLGKKSGDAWPIVRLLHLLETPHQQEASIDLDLRLVFCEFRNTLAWIRRERDSDPTQFAVSLTQLAGDFPHWNVGLSYEELANCSEQLTIALALELRIHVAMELRLAEERMLKQLLAMPLADAERIIFNDSRSLIKPETSAATTPQGKQPGGPFEDESCVTLGAVLEKIDGWLDATGFAFYIINDPLTSTIPPNKRMPFPGTAEQQTRFFALRRYVSEKRELIYRLQAFLHDHIDLAQAIVTPIIKAWRSAALGTVLEMGSELVKWLTDESLMRSRAELKGESIYHLYYPFDGCGLYQDNLIDCASAMTNVKFVSDVADKEPINLGRTKFLPVVCHIRDMHMKTDDIVATNPAYRDYCHQQLRCAVHGNYRRSVVRASFLQSMWLNVWLDEVQQQQRQGNKEYTDSYADILAHAIREHIVLEQYNNASIYDTVRILFPSYSVYENTWLPTVTDTFRTELYSSVQVQIEQTLEMQQQWCQSDEGEPPTAEHIANPRLYRVRYNVAWFVEVMQRFMGSFTQDVVIPLNAHAKTNFNHPAPTVYRRPKTDFVKYLCKRMRESYLGYRVKYFMQDDRFELPRGYWVPLSAKYRSLVEYKKAIAHYTDCVDVKDVLGSKGPTFLRNIGVGEEGIKFMKAIYRQFMQRAQDSEIDKLLQAMNARDRTLCYHFYNGLRLSSKEYVSLPLDTYLRQESALRRHYNTPDNEPLPLKIACIYFCSKNACGQLLTFVRPFHEIGCDGNRQLCLDLDAGRIVCDPNNAPEIPDAMMADSFAELLQSAAEIAVSVSRGDPENDVIAALSGVYADQDKSAQQKVPSSGQRHALNAADIKSALTSPSHLPKAVFDALQGWTNQRNSIAQMAQRTKKPGVRLEKAHERLHVLKKALIQALNKEGRKDMREEYRVMDEDGDVYAVPVLGKAYPVKKPTDKEGFMLVTVCIECGSKFAINLDQKDWSRGPMCGMCDAIKRENFRRPSCINCGTLMYVQPGDAIPTTCIAVKKKKKKRQAKKPDPTAATLTYVPPPPSSRGLTVVPGKPAKKRKVNAAAMDKDLGGGGNADTLRGLDTVRDDDESTVTAPGTPRSVSFSGGAGEHEASLHESAAAVDGADSASKKKKKTTRTVRFGALSLAEKLMPENWKMYDFADIARGGTEPCYVCGVCNLSWLKAVEDRITRREAIYFMRNRIYDFTQVAEYFDIE